MAHQWIYFFGERTGIDVKIGRTTNSDLTVYLRKINRDQTTTESYVMLAAVRGEPSNERALHKHFAQYRRTDKGGRTEYFFPADELVEYVNWLRTQGHCVSVDTTRAMDEIPVVDPGEWWPASDGRRRVGRPVDDPTRIIQDYESEPGPLQGTAWSWMMNPRASVQDYYTPSEIVVAAAEAMGGLDLDAAGHYIAYNEHRKALGFTYRFFHRNDSAFKNRWWGRVWLNPPYGDNEPWFDCIQRYVESGDIKELCMLSPVWAFNTNIAGPVIALSSAFVLLAPTPRFWGNSDPSRTGTNNPHGILYIGDDPLRFVRAFAPLGIPMRILSEGDF